MVVAGGGATVDVSVELITRDVVTDDAIAVEDVVTTRLVVGDGLLEGIVDTALGLLEAA